MNWTLTGLCFVLMILTLIVDGDTAKSLGATAWFLLSMVALDSPTSTRGVSK